MGSRTNGVYDFTSFSVGAYNAENKSFRLRKVFQPAFTLVGKTELDLFNFERVFCNSIIEKNVQSWLFSRVCAFLGWALSRLINERKSHQSRLIRVFFSRRRMLKSFSPFTYVRRLFVNHVIIFWTQDQVLFIRFTNIHPISVVGKKHLHENFRFFHGKQLSQKLTVFKKKRIQKFLSSTLFYQVSITFWG